MNLVIDIGNTLVKLAVFNDGMLQVKKNCSLDDFLMTLSEINEAYPKIKDAIVSSVGRFTKIQFSELKKRYVVFVLTHQAALPFVNKYASPKTLGVDRIALIAAAAVQYPHKNVLVIDAGSCITYDFLSQKNEYLGGAISLGLSMRYEALHHFTAELPNLTANNPKKLVGNTTALSIHSGVVNGLLYEIIGFISSYNEKYTDLTIILTGGDAHFLRDSIKNDIFANSNFLLEGLNIILEHNKD